MAGRIPKSFIDELVGRADIVEVVGARVTLKRAGSNYKGLCPFHGEKTPSFIVTPSRGTYHCFGCSAHGTALGFLMAYDNLEFPEAVEALAEMMGLEVPRENAGAPERKDDNEELYALLREADQIYRATLRGSDKAVAYLKKRGIDGPTAGRFGIGYAPDAWDTVLKQLGTSDARIAKLLQAGLLSANDSGRRYDRFRDRIMFPIRSARGHVIGFGGRVLDTGEPKYLNSPETPVFRKGHELYGLYEARQNPGRPKQIIVVEGYLDVASLVQFGVEYVVATLGTAMTAENLRRLSRLTDRIVFCFDGDAAGRAAASRAMETALPFGGGNVDIRFLLLPEKDDPDTFVRSQGADAFRALAAGAIALPDFFVAELDKRVDFKSTGGRGRFDVSAKPLLRRLPEGSYRETILDALRGKMGLAPDVFQKLMDDAPAFVVEQQRPTQTGGGKRKTVVQKVINLALHYPGAAVRAADSEQLAALNQPGADLLRRVFAAAAEIGDGSTARVLETLRDDPDFHHLQRIVAEPPLGIETEDAAASELAASLEHLGKDAARAADAQRIRGHRPGTGPA
ncbi:MAG TPA: DNA primase [Gammaproteobacteria bacterium]|nr:DNA primase [Gammaproteobacteria bacterium]